MRIWSGSLTALAVSALIFTAACGSSAPPEDAAETKTEAPVETAKLEPPAPEPPPVEPAPEKPAEPEAAPKAAPKKVPSGNPVVVVETTMGTFKLELFEDKAPLSVKNFLQYVDDKYYDGTIFHRVVTEGIGIIQGGGFTPDMEQKETREPIQNEAANMVSNERGTIAMARTFMPHSATSQFFINQTSNKMLDQGAQPGWGYCVFGKVIEGMDVIDKIAAVKTGRNGMHENVPVEPILIKSARRVS